MKFYFLLSFIWFCPLLSQATIYEDSIIKITLLNNKLSYKEILSGTTNICYQIENKTNKIIVLGIPMGFESDSYITMDDKSLVPIYTRYSKGFYNGYNENNCGDYFVLVNSYQILETELPIIEINSLYKLEENRIHSIVISSISNELLVARYGCIDYIDKLKSQGKIFPNLKIKTKINIFP